jgi:UDP:flavonoid glycosyltransferase YjiC (YdhE family)
MPGYRFDRRRTGRFLCRAGPLRKTRRPVCSGLCLSVHSHARISQRPRAIHSVPSSRLGQPALPSPCAADDVAKLPRRRKPGAPPGSANSSRTLLWGPFGVFNRGAGTILYGYSWHVISIPTDWSDSMHVTGFWQLEPPPGWKPPAGLVDFLEASPPPVYIGFGSMTHRKPVEVTQMVLRAPAQSGQRAVLSAGWGGIGDGVLPKSVFPVGSVPHD